MHCGVKLAFDYVFYFSWVTLHEHPDNLESCGFFSCGII